MATFPIRTGSLFYARHFNTVEVNASFYHHQRKSTFEHWRDQTPKDFTLVVKGRRYLTHVKRLADLGRPLQQSREALPLKFFCVCPLKNLPAEKPYGG